LKILPFAWTALISNLIGIEVKIEEPISIKKIQDPVEETQKIINEVKEEFKNYWKCFQN
jgi:hypothetical protein